MKSVDTLPSAESVSQIIDQWPQMGNLERAFLRQFIALGIEVDTELKSASGTLRRVKKIEYSELEGCEGKPVAIDTIILEGNMHGKTYFRVREVAIGARKYMFKVVKEVGRWTDHA